MIQIINSWFPDSERSLVTGIIFTVSPVGNGLSNFLNLYYYQKEETLAETEQSIYDLLWVHFWLAFVAFIYFELTF